MKKPFSGIVLALLLTSMLMLTFNIPPTKASGTIYIRADGSIDPPTANITRNGDLYTLTNDTYDSIVIERNNMTLDGAGYKVKGTETTGSIGISLSGRSNVTIKNIEIESFLYGVSLSDSSSHNNIIGSNITANTWYGIYVEYSSNNSIVGNSVANNGEGIKLFAISSNNSIVGNNITANSNYGITIRASSNNMLRNNNMTGNSFNFFVDGGSLSEFIHDVDASNTVDGKPIYYWINETDRTIPFDASYVALINCTHITVQNLQLSKNGQGALLAYTTNSIIAKNNITTNYIGIGLKQSSSNKFYHNNFINNTNQVKSIGSTNVWDDGYPSGGNYWSDHISVDLYSGPYQNETRKDGIGDLPYVIDGINKDRYPVMIAYGQPKTLFVPTRYKTIQEAINTANPKDEIFVFSETYYENVVVNKTVSFIGENRNLTIIDGMGIESVVSVINSDNILIKGFTIRNSNLSEWHAGIRVYQSNNCTITENNVTQNNFGILVTNSNYTLITHSNISFNLYGCKFQQGSKNATIKGNIVENNTHYGVDFDDLSNNFSFVNNMLKANEYGINITGSASEGIIYNNNFVDNIHQVGGNPLSTEWDDGYPSCGNYWSDYTGVDLYNGPYQNITGSDGIGDTPYVINASNQDNYPLMNPWININITNILYSKPVVGQGYSATINVTVENQGYNTATFNVTTYAGATVIEMKQTTLSGGISYTISFVWNTSGFVKGNYTIKAIADTVLGERDTLDNTHINGWILIARVGDFGSSVNYVPTFFACDGKVNGYDLALFIACYKGPPQCPPNAVYLGDLGGQIDYIPTFFVCDGNVDGYDLALFILCYKGLGP